MGKFLRRHRVGAAFVVIAIGLTAFYTIRLSQETNRARREAEKATRVSQFVEGLFNESDPWESRGANPTARDLLDDGMQRVEEELREEPEVLSEMLTVIGGAYSGLAEYNQSLEAYSKALRIREGLPSDP